MLNNVFYDKKSKTTPKNLINLITIDLFNYNFNNSQKQSNIKDLCKNK